MTSNGAEQGIVPSPEDAGASAAASTTSPSSAPGEVLGHKGAAPWERSGAAPMAGPEDPATQAKAERARQLQAQLEREQREADAARAQRREEKRLAKLKQEEETKKELEDIAKKMFWIGVFLLPGVWANMIWYYWKEIKDPEASPVIKKYCRYAMYLLPVYTLVFGTWYIVFLVFRNGRLKDLDIINNDFSFDDL